MVVPHIDNTKNDLYPMELEDYHNEIMNSIGTLEYEMNECAKIIEYKKKNGFDFESWNLKLQALEGRSDLILRKIIIDKMPYNEYKKLILVQLENEKENLKKFEQYTKIDNKMKEIAMERILKRIDIINNEISEGEQLYKQNENPLETENINEPLLQKIKLRYKEYKSALSYFEENGMKSQEKDALSKVRTILSIAKRYKNKETFSEFELPTQITPEYIYGYSKEERLNKFKEVLRELIKEKGVAKTQFKIYQKEENVEKIESYLSTITKYERLIKVIKEQVKNQWVPAPKYTLNNQGTSQRTFSVDKIYNAFVVKDGKEEQKGIINISEEDLKNYDSVDNIYSLKVIEYKLEEVTKEIEKNKEQKTPKELKDRLNMLNAKKKLIEKLLKEENMKENYLELIKTQLVLDKRFAERFEEKNDKKAAGIVKRRIKVASEEIKQLENNK